MTTISYGQYTKKFDKYKNETVHRYETPYISFNKYVNSNDTMYQTAFTTYDTYLTASGKGAILLFSDSTKMEFNGEVDVDYSSKGYYRYTYYNYDKEVVEKLSMTKLIGFKLHIFEKDLSLKNRDLVIAAARKILVSK